MASGPRSWGKSGNSALGNTALICGGVTPFYPASLFVENLDSTDSFYINWQDAAAAVADDVHNILMFPGRGYSFNFNTQNVTNTFTLNIIAVANTPAYNIFAIADR